MHQIFVLFVYICLINSILSYKILVFSPTVSRSHMISNGRIADELARHGHNVTLLEPDWLGLHDKVDAAKFAKRVVIRGFSDRLIRVIQQFSGSAFEPPSMLAENWNLMQYQYAYNEHCEDLINRDGVMNELRNEHFDAYFGEQINLCGHGIARALDIKSIFWISSGPMGEQQAYFIGLPTPLAYIPSIISMDMGLKPTYMQRVENIIRYVQQIAIVELANYDLDRMFRKKFGPQFPSMAQLAGESDVLFISTDPFIQLSRPEMPNMVHIGSLGSSRSTAAPLSEKWNEIMEQGNLGVVYFSFGTVINTTTLPNFAMKTIIGLANHFPNYQFIFKVDSQDSYSRNVSAEISNALVLDWTPQPSVLAHPRLKAFITHAGYNGIMEAAWAAVPLVAMPFFFDQTLNSYAVEQHGWAVRVNRFTLRQDPEQLRNALHSVLTEERYSLAAKRISRLVREQPFNASQKLVKTTEFVISMGGVKELLVEGRQHSIWLHYNLDILIPAFIVFQVLIYAAVRLSFFIFKFIFYSKVTSNRPKKQKVN